VLDGATKVSTHHHRYNQGRVHPSCSKRAKMAFKMFVYSHFCFENVCHMCTCRLFQVTIHISTDLFVFKWVNIEHIYQNIVTD